ncbi:hypothetical protein EIY72_09755 [Pseudomonas vancouverensis]|uniref:Uncharacterized protein n=1 Tax=Pseudomonas vancouverensis TaxID=95300 RepID=A0A4R4KA93_PSEVA|nr:hypothetical protein F7R09_12680 [Pseudomonas vancouverensis]TDB64700.1 hypothetical protein EIY72_09755 [Pseudomonas vancouverensis]
MGRHYPQHHETCGSELARESGVSFDIKAVWHYAFASKLAPTGICVRPGALLLLLHPGKPLP